MAKLLKNRNHKHIMSTVLLLLILAIGSTTLGVKGSVLFHNTGTTSGWDNINHEHNGIVQSVTDVYYEGPTSLLTQQTYDASYNGRYHSELVHNDGYKRGDMRFYGFMFRLAPNWQFQPTQSYNIMQFIADFSDKLCDDYIPTTMVWLIGNQLHTRVQHGDPCNRETIFYHNIATVSAGTWNKIEIQANWQSSNTGYFKLWFNGAKVVEQFNIGTTLDDSRTLQFRVGLYANGWHDDNQNKGTQNVRKIWYDEIGIGTTFADADPDQW